MEITILQWNIWYKEDIRNIVSFLKEVDADIACLQELTVGSPDQTVNNTIKHVANELSYQSAFKQIDLGEGKINIANGIFSRFPISNVKTTWINEPNGSGGYDDEYRAYVQADIEVNGRKLTIGTVHMSYTHAFENTPRKLEETENLTEAIKGNKKNFLITGDFNALPGSKVIEKIENTGLKNCGPDYSQKSWTTKPFDYNGFKANTLDWRLDYAFATPDIKVESVEILRTDFSDHLPLLLKISF